jgi:hypothetical protein
MAQLQGLRLMVDWLMPASAALTLADSCGHFAKRRCHYRNRNASIFKHYINIFLKLNDLNE